jgi:cob(I)alamin adenosyltransferase
MPIYTRAGDTGTTSLFGGKKVLKCNELVDVYGSIDELNSWVGHIISQTKDKRTAAFLQTIQQDLFIIGSTLAGFPGDIPDIKKRVVEMEKHMETIAKNVPAINNFILPGGSGTGAEIHIVRSIARRVERQTVALRENHKNDSVRFDEILMYLNRFSDYLFMLARSVNKNAGKNEIIWKQKLGK